MSAKTFDTLNIGLGPLGPNVTFLGPIGLSPVA